MYIYIYKKNTNKRNIAKYYYNLKQLFTTIILILPQFKITILIYFEM